MFVAARHAYLSQPGWFAATLTAAAPLKGVAYFSMEFGLGAALPLYAGGLGVLAGDYMKTASDLGVPVIGDRPALSGRLFPPDRRCRRTAAGALSLQRTREPAGRTGHSGRRQLAACPARISRPHRAAAGVEGASVGRVPLCICSTATIR